MWQSLFRVSDAGATVLFTFVAKFIQQLSANLALPCLQTFADSLPKNVASARHLLGRRDNFEKWVCCQKCSSLYTVEDAKSKQPNGVTSSKLCSFVRYRNHPQSQHRKPCGHPLMKNVRTSSGSLTLYPRALYCYKSLIVSLEEMLQRPGFIKKTE